MSLPNPVSVWTIRLLPPSASGARRARLLVSRLRGAEARASVTPATGSEDVTELDPERARAAVYRWDHAARATCAAYAEILDGLQPAPTRALAAAAV